jgi:hypothetical protein
MTRSSADVLDRIGEVMCRGCKKKRRCQGIDSVMDEMDQQQQLEDCAVRHIVAGKDLLKLVKVWSR